MFAQPNERYQMPQPTNVHGYNQLLSRLNLQVIRQQYDAFQQQQQQQPQQPQELHQQMLPQQPVHHQQQQQQHHNDSGLNNQDELSMSYQSFDHDHLDQNNSDISNQDRDMQGNVASPSHSSSKSRSSGGKISKRGQKSRDSKDKIKRIRTIFTPEQLRLLEQEFARQMYLVGKDRDDLSNFLGLSQAQVKVWFQNRRIKYRKTMASS